MGKIQTCFTVSGRVKRVFGLHHSLHTSIFEVKMNCAGGERLIDDVGKGFCQDQPSREPEAA